MAMIPSYTGGGGRRSGRLSVQSDTTTISQTQSYDGGHSVGSVAGDTYDAFQYNNMTSTCDELTAPMQYELSHSTRDKQRQERFYNQQQQQQHLQHHLLSDSRASLRRTIRPPSRLVNEGSHSKSHSNRNTNTNKVDSKRSIGGKGKASVESAMKEQRAKTQALRKQLQEKLQSSHSNSSNSIEHETVDFVSDRIESSIKNEEANEGMNDNEHSIEDQQNNKRIATDRDDHDAEDSSKWLSTTAVPPPPVLHYISSTAPVRAVNRLLQCDDKKKMLQAMKPLPQGKSSLFCCMCFMLK